MIDFKIYSFKHFGSPKPNFVPGISGMPETLPETSMPETLPTLLASNHYLRRVEEIRKLRKKQLTASLQITRYRIMWYILCRESGWRTAEYVWRKMAGKEQKGVAKGISNRRGVWSWYGRWLGLRSDKNGYPWMAPGLWMQSFYN